MENEQQDQDLELLNKLKQRKVKGPSSWRRRRGSKDQEGLALDDSESELLERLKQRQSLYKQKVKAQRKDQDTEQVSGLHSVPPLTLGMGMGPGGDTVQLQLQFLQQQVLQQQMMQLQQQFHQLHSYALQQGVSMPTNVMLPSGGVLNQQSAFMATPMAPPTGIASAQQQQVMMQTSAGGGPMLVPGAQLQGVVPTSQVQIPGQGFAQTTVPPTGQRQQLEVYGQGIPQPQPPLPSISTATSQPMVYGQGISQAPPQPHPLPPTQPPIMSTCVAPDNATTVPSEPVSSSAEQAVSDKTGRSGKVQSVFTPARMSNKKRSEDVRALVLGPLEEQFDSLMDQVREADPEAVLKKVWHCDDLYHTIIVVVLLTT